MLRACSPTTPPQGEEALRQHLAICETLTRSSFGRDAAVAVLETERLLAGEGRVSEEWRDVWQAPWRRWVATRWAGGGQGRELACGARLKRGGAQRGWGSCGARLAGS